MGDSWWFKMSGLIPLDPRIDLASDEWDSLQEEINNFFINLPENTKDAYLNDIQKYFWFLKLNKIHPYKARQIHVEEFMRFISLQGGKIIDGKAYPAKDRTFNRKLAALSSFYKYLGSKRIITEDPTAFVKFRKVPLKIETNDLSNESVQRLFELIPEDNFKHCRDKAINATFFYTGMRRKEVMDLKFGDYKKHNGHSFFKARVKGGKDADIPINSELEIILDKYLLKLKEVGIILENHHPLFGSLQNPYVRLSPNGISLIFNRWVDKLGLDYDTSPHSARATFIGELHDNNVPLDENAEASRHNDSRITKAYIQRKKLIEKSPIYGISFKKK